MFSTDLVQPLPHDPKRPALLRAFDVQLAAAQVAALESLLADQRALVATYGANVPCSCGVDDSPATVAHKLASNAYDSATYDLAVHNVVRVAGMLALARDAHTDALEALGVDDPSTVACTCGAESPAAYVERWGVADGFNHARGCATLASIIGSGA